MLDILHQIVSSKLMKCPYREREIVASGAKPPTANMQIVTHHHTLYLLSSGCIVPLASMLLFSATS